MEPPAWPRGRRSTCLAATACRKSEDAGRNVTGSEQESVDGSRWCEDLRLLTPTDGRVSSVHREETTRAKHLDLMTFLHSWFCLVFLPACRIIKKVLVWILFSRGKSVSLIKKNHQIVVLTWIQTRSTSMDKRRFYLLTLYWTLVERPAKKKHI